MPEPHDRISDELISAYLDGEVDPQQRTRVEQLLDSEPRYQQMLEELRTLRETLQSLPRRRLDAGFPERVLRTAEQRSAAARQVTRTPDPAARTSSGGFQRGLIWAAAAVAAAVVVTVFGPEAARRDMGPVAQNPPAPQAPDSAAAAEDRAAGAVVRRRYAGKEQGVSPEALGRSEPAPEGVAGGGVLDAEGLDRLKLPTGAVQTFEKDDDSSGLVLDAMGSDDGVRGEALSEQPELRMPTIDQPVEQPATDLALGESESVESRRMLEESSVASSAELSADTVIYVRLAAAEKGADALLTDNLMRNQITVVGQEPPVTRAKRAVEQRQKDRAIYFSNKRAVDFAFVPTEPETNTYRLYLVQAPITQIAAAVNELQQEGGTVEVLTAIAGPQPEAARFAVRNGEDVQAGRTSLEAGTMAAKGQFEESAEQRLEDRPLDHFFWDEIIEGTKAFDERFARMNRDQAPARGAQTGKSLGLEHDAALDADPATPAQEDQKMRRSQTPRKPRTPVPSGQTGGWGIANHSRGLDRQPQQHRFTSPAPNGGQRTPAAPIYGRDSRSRQLAPLQFGQSVTPPDSLPVEQRNWYEYQTSLKDPQELEKQLVGLGEDRGRARPLQVLFVLHNEADLAASTDNAAPPATEALADPAPSDPR